MEVMVAGEEIKNIIIIIISVEIRPSARFAKSIVPAPSASIANRPASSSPWAQLELIGPIGHQFCECCVPSAATYIQIKKSHQLIIKLLYKPTNCFFQERTPSAIYAYPT